MRLSELRPCDGCGAVLGPHFIVLRHTQAMVNTRAARSVVGLSVILGGALRLAEAMAPSDEAFTVLGDEDGTLLDEFLLCPECGFGDVRLGELLENARARRKRTQAGPEESVRESV